MRPPPTWKLVWVVPRFDEDQVIAKLGPGWVGGQRDRFVHELIRSNGPDTLYEEWVAFGKRISGGPLAIRGEICETWE